MRGIVLLSTAVAALQPTPLPRRASATARSDLRKVRLAEGNDNPLLRSVANFGKEKLAAATEALEKEMRIAAMQDPEQFEPQETVEAVPLPDSFDDAVRLATQGCSEAIADGRTLLVAEFDTSAGDETYNMLSRTLKFVQPFLPQLTDVLVAENGGAEDDPSPRIQLLFPDEGTAAYVKQNWKDLPARTVCSSMPRAKLAEGVEALVLVAPAATEVPAVQRLVRQVEEEAPTTIVLLVNPKLVDMQSTGYGLVGRELRNMVEEAFSVTFALKSYPDGALFRMYPEGWSVWREDADAEGGYDLAYSGMRRPSGDDIDEYLVPDDVANGEGGGGGNFFDGLDKFIKGFQAL